MSSGVGLHSQCIPTFSILKTGKRIKDEDIPAGQKAEIVDDGDRPVGKKPVYIIYGLSKDNAEIVVKWISHSSDWSDFTKNLPRDECRWAVYDLPVKKGEITSNKLMFVAWSPDEAKIKNKMVYASSKDALRRKLDISNEVQATDASEIALEAVHDKMARV